MFRDSRRDAFRASSAARKVQSVGGPIVHVVLYTQAMMRRIVVRWDGTAFPVWDAECMASLDGLTMSDALREELRQWSKAAPGTMWGDYEPFVVGTKPAPADEPTRLAEWQSTGVQLADRLGEELGSSYEVVFGD